MIRRTLLIVLTHFCLACNLGKQQEQPSVSDEKMSRIMADLAIADAATNGIAGYDRDSLMQVYFNQVLELHGLTLEQHEKNLRIFANDTDRMKKMLDQAEVLLDTSKWH